MTRQLAPPEPTLLLQLLLKLIVEPQYLRALHHTPNLLGLTSAHVSQNTNITPRSFPQANSTSVMQPAMLASPAPSASNNSFALVPAADSQIRLHGAKPKMPPGFPPADTLEMSDEERATYMDGCYPSENREPSLEINYLVSDELAQATNQDPSDLKFQADVKAAYSQESSIEAIKEVFSGLDVRSKFHFGYRDYVPQGGVDLSEKAEDRQHNAALKGIAKHITRQRKHAFSRFQINSGKLFVVVAPLREGMRATGFATQNGAFALATDPETALHEIGHLLGGRHEFATGFGFLGKFVGRTIMYPTTDMGLFPQMKFSDPNAQEMRRQRKFYPVSIWQNGRHREIFHLEL
ncbi:hypothetical protein [Paraburkholderia humisilvae]